MKNPCHSDQTFWKQNIMRFEEKDCEVLKCDPQKQIKTKTSKKTRAHSRLLCAPSVSVHCLGARCVGRGAADFHAGQVPYPNAQRELESGPGR
jgi:hypothetical protein